MPSFFATLVQQVAEPFRASNLKSPSVLHCPPALIGGLPTGQPDVPADRYALS